MTRHAALLRDFEASLARGRAPDWPHAPLAWLGATGDGELPIADALWRRDDLHELAHRNALDVATALVAILDRRRPLAGREKPFLDAWQWFVGIHERERRPVWADPRAYFWVRRLHGLTFALLAGADLDETTAAYAQALGGDRRPGDVADVLMAHLDAFDSFCLGLAVVTGRAWLPERSVVVQPSTLLPGTGLRSDAAAPARLLGVEDGSVQGPSGAELVRAEQLTVRGPLVEPRCFAACAMAFAAPALEAKSDVQDTGIRLAAEALDAMVRHVPAINEQFHRAIRVIAFKAPEAGGYDDYSEPELPGSFVVSVVPQPLELADHLIHELQHNRLSFLEECGPLFEPGESNTGQAIYYSPWRSKPRGLYGIFHGVYVFCAVSRFWLGALRSVAPGSSERAYVIDRLLRLPRQLSLALRVLRRHARLTAFGEAILRELAKESESLNGALRRAGLPSDAPAMRLGPDGQFERDPRGVTVLESLREHWESVDAHETCDADPVLGEDLPA